MYICYGIINGPNSSWWPMDSEEGRYLWRAPIGGIAAREKDDLVLTVPEFDSTKSTAVRITLSRKGSDVPLVELMQNSYSLAGKPELVWGGERE